MATYMHSDHDIFVEGIKRKRKVKLTFRSREDSGDLVIQCAPMDYRPARRARDASDYYHFWCSDEEFYSFETGKSSRVLQLPSDRIVGMEPTENAFDPAEFSTANINWFFPPSHWRFNPLFMFLKRLLTKPDKTHGADRRAKR